MQTKNNRYIHFLGYNIGSGDSIMGQKIIILGLTVIDVFMTVTIIA